MDGTLSAGVPRRVINPRTARALPMGVKRVGRIELRVENVPVHKGDVEEAKAKEN
jgi:hypothetical protein